MRSDELRARERVYIIVRGLCNICCSVLKVKGMNTSNCYVSKCLIDFGLRGIDLAEAMFPSSHHHLQTAFDSPCMPLVRSAGLTSSLT